MVRPITGEKCYVAGSSKSNDTAQESWMVSISTAIAVY
jgi:hypothetical protein